MTRFTPSALALLLLAAPLGAQTGHQHSEHASPYAGEMEERSIKALPEAQVQGLLEGEGLGFALAAELNGLPGPRHVLDLADELDLTADQRDAVEDVQARMAEQARELGARVVAAERHLDHMFARRHATAEAVQEETADIARLRGALRATHLTAHLETAAILEPGQVERYVRLRGYDVEGG